MYIDYNTTLHFHDKISVSGGAIVAYQLVSLVIQCANPGRGGSILFLLLKSPSIFRFLLHQSFLPRIRSFSTESDQVVAHGQKIS
jgi:hypothetical protein